MDDSDEELHLHLQMEMDSPSLPHDERAGTSTAGNARRDGLRSVSISASKGAAMSNSKSPVRKSPRLAKKTHVSYDSFLEITQSPNEPTPVRRRGRFRKPHPQKPIITTNVMAALEKFKDGTERESRPSFLESSSDSSEAFAPSLQRKRLRYGRQYVSPRKTETAEEIAPNVMKALKIVQAGQSSGLPTKDGEGESDVSLEDDELDNPITPAYIPKRKGTLKRATENPKPAMGTPNLRVALAATVVETHGDGSSDTSESSPILIRKKRPRKNTDAGPPQALLAPNLQAALQEYKKVQEEKKDKLRRSKNETPKKASPFADKVTLDGLEGLGKSTGSPAIAGATAVDKESKAVPPRPVVSVSPEEALIDQRPVNEENSRRRLSSEKQKSAKSGKTSPSYLRRDGSSAKQRFFRPRSSANSFEEPSVLTNEKASFKAQSQSTPRASKVTNADKVLVPERPPSRMSVLSGISFASTALSDLEENANVSTTQRSTHNDSLANPNRITEDESEEEVEEAIVPSRNIVASRPAKSFNVAQQLSRSKGRIEEIEDVLIALPKAQDSSNQRQNLSLSGLGRKPSLEPRLTPVGRTSRDEPNTTIRSKSFQKNLSSVQRFTIAVQEGIEEGINNEDILVDTSKASKRDNNSSRKSRTIDEVLAEAGEVDVGGPGISKKPKSNSFTTDSVQDVRVQLSVSNSVAGTLKSVINFDKSAAFIASKQKLLDLDPIPEAISKNSSGESVVSASIEEQNYSQLSISKVKETGGSKDPQNDGSPDEPSDESADSGTTDENPELVGLIDSAERQVLDSSDNLDEDQAIPETGVEEFEKQDEVQVKKAAASSYSIPEVFNPTRSYGGRISATNITLDDILTNLDTRKPTWVSTPMERFLTNRRTDVENTAESSRNLQEKEVDKNSTKGKSWAKPGTSESTKGKSWAKPAGTSESTRREQDKNNLSDMINAMIKEPVIPKVDWQAIGKALSPAVDKPVKQRSMKEFVSSLSPGMQKHLAELPTTMGPPVIVPPKEKLMKRSTGLRKPRNDDPQPLYITRGNMGFYCKLPFNTGALTEMHAATSVWTDIIVEGLQEFLDYKNINALRGFEDIFELTLYQGSFTNWREYSDFVRTHLPHDMCKQLVPFDMELPSLETKLKWTVKTQKRIETMVRQYAEIYATDDEDDQEASERV